MPKQALIEKRAKQGKEIFLPNKLAYAKANKGKERELCQSWQGR